jgi:hypothetical protein
MADDEQAPDDTPPDFQPLVNGFTLALRNGAGLGKTASWLVNTIVQAFLAIVGVTIRSLTRIVTTMLAALSTVLEQDNPELGRMAEKILGMMFGRTLQDAIPGSILDPGDLDAAAPAVGAAILQSIFGVALDNEGGELQPSTELGDRFLGVIATFVTRGFVMDLLLEVIPEWHFDAAHHIEHELISGLGLGRLSRQILRPLVHTLIATPAEWKANLAYRPKLHNEGDALKLHALGEIDDGELDEELGRQGWSNQRIERLRLLHDKPADFGALTTLIDHGVLDDADVEDALRHEGFSETGAREKIAAHKLSRFDPWLVKEADEWLAKYKDGLIDKGTFVSSLRATQLPDDILQLLVNIGGAHRETRRRLLSQGDLFSAWEHQVLTQNEVHDGLVDLGYDEPAATTLILTRLAIGQRKEEVDQLKHQQAADRAAAKAADKAARLEAAKQARLDAAAERARKAAQLAAERAQAKADDERRRQFIADAAEHRRALVDAQHQAGLISGDHAAALKETIQADEAALLAQAASMAADSLAAFHTELLALKRADREAEIEQQLADVDLSTSADAAARAAGVTARLHTVDLLLAAKRAEIADLMAARGTVIEADLAASLALVDTKMLPTREERAADAAAKIAAADAELPRKMSDLADEFAARHASIEDELSRGILTEKTAAREHDRASLAQQQAERLAQQSHDFAVQRLRDAATATDALSVATADADRLTLQAAAEKARQQLAADRTAAELAAAQTADAERLRLQGIEAQAGPLSAAAATKARAKVAAHDAALKRQESLQAAQLAHAEDVAKASAARAQTAVAAARQRLALLASTSGGKEAAAAAADAQLAAFDLDVESRRRQLEAEIASHRGAGDTVAAPQ